MPKMTPEKSLQEFTAMVENFAGEFLRDRERIAEDLARNPKDTTITTEATLFCDTTERFLKNVFSLSRSKVNNKLSLFNAAPNVMQDQEKPPITKKSRR